jgi:holin-like protein
MSMYMRQIWRWSREALQLVFFMGVWMAGDALARHWGSRIPGSVWGLAATLGMLFFGAIPAALIESGARWLLAEMLLFFVPLCVGIAGYGDLLRHEGMQLAGAILLGTVAVMVGTAWVVDAVYRWEVKWNAVREEAGGEKDGE